MALNGWSTTALNNSSVGGINWGEGMMPSAVNNSGRAMMSDVRYEIASIGSTVSAGATTDLGAIQEGTVVLSGNATISSFGTTATTGLRRKLRFTGTPTIAHSAGAITCPGSANITVAAGDTCEVICEGTDAFRIWNYQRADGTPLVGLLSINSLTTETAPATGDAIPHYNASAGANRKITVANLFKVINGFSGETAGVASDAIPIYSSSAGAARKVALSDLLKVVNTLTTESAAASGDKFLMYNASAGAVRAITKANLATGPFSASFTSTAQAVPAAAGTLTVAHSLGAVPFGIQIYMKCTSADQGWSVNDTVIAPYFGDGGGTGYGGAAYADSTNVYVLMGNGRLAGFNKSSGASVVLDATKWNLIVKAWV